MRRSEAISGRFDAASLLMWLYPALLLVANVALCFTERYSFLTAAANLLLPAGVFLLIASASRNVGRTILLCLPLSIYAAFQIVLLFLYGESIIAIDMFLNVVTTNPAEVNELLGNLGRAIATVVLIYVPPIACAVWLLCTRRRAAEEAVRKARRTAFCLCGAGLLTVGAAYAASPDYSLRRRLFPVNVMDNTVQAVVRYHATRDYPATSSSFRFGAASTRPDSLPEVYVLVVGETCRADNWQLLGYDRPTNPRLSRRDDLVAFSKVLSESNTTHKSVPLLLSPLTAENFGDSIYCVKSIFEAFREAGYATAFFSNQRRNHSFIDFFGEQADSCHFISDTPGALRSDSVLVPMAAGFIADNPGRKVFVVLHCYGSHFNYRDRYSAAHSVFRPDDNTSASADNRDGLLNAYDNTIVSTDAMLDDLASALDSLPDSCASAMLFIPDHGEDIFDDDRGRFLHASPAPTYWQIHVPMLLWTSRSHRDKFPSLWAAAQKNADAEISSSRSVFDTMLSLAGISSPYARPFRAVTDSSYRPESRVYLNDYNEGVRLRDAGLHEEDMEMFARKGISAR